MKQGFSLLELSIVLVIIGLITGGIMAGQSMVRAAELRSVMTDIRKYQTAINTFKDKYMALPGDMKNATSYWGVAAAGAACATTQGTGTQTCDGNGDGIISGGTLETFRVWQHLANAGLIEGQYAGIAISGTFAVGANIPASRISGVGYALWSQGNSAGDANWYAANYNHVLTVGALDSLNGAFSPQDMASVDSKTDDGMPGTGRMMTLYWSNFSNSSSKTDTAATYKLTNGSKACVMLFDNYLE